MKNYYTLKTGLACAVFALISFCQTSVFAQVSLASTGGTPTGTFLTVSEAFVAINAGTHTGSIAISINGNTTEPSAPVYLVASGQATASYTDILIKPTVVATIAGATAAGSAVINMDGADNVTIDGSIAIGGTTRDLTIQNTAVNTVANIACVRLIGRTTLGLGATNNTIKNCNITGSTPGNNGLSGSVVTTTYGIYAGSAILTTMAATSGGADYDNLTIQNNFITNAYYGINVIGTIAPTQADNLQIVGNTVGSVSARIGFKGIVAQHVVGGNATNNTVTAIEATSSISVAGMDFSGSASNGFAIRSNTISDIHSFNTGGWGAYGINITSGINYSITNNVIHGVQTVNYTTSTTFNAFGIRLAGGTGHQLYYNSVNMYGAYTTGNVTNAISAALLVTGVGVIGLDIRNNVFANKMTSTATTPEFLAVSFPNTYNFVNANLERNAYFVTPDAFHFIGKIALTVGANNFSNLNNWRTVSQVNNATNDVNSHPGSGNANAPFTSDTDLTVPAATSTVMESSGLPVAALGLPNVDKNNVNRPAGSGTNPDLGAYEFEGSVPGDIVSPTVSAVSAAPGAQCTAVSHTVTATVIDNVGATTVTLAYSYNGVAQTPITMSLISGTALNGTYSAVIPAAAGPNVTVTYSVQAVDAGLNTSSSVSGTQYADAYLVVTASADQTINTGVATVVSATTNDPSFGRLLISEVVQNKAGTGGGVYPGYVPAVDNDYVEIINIGDVAADAGGYTMTLYGGVTGSYTIPANTIIPSGQTLVLAFSGTASDPGNRYFGMNLLTTSSGVAMGWVLRNPQGQIKDVVGTNSYVFGGATGVTAGDWSGATVTNSGLAGSRRTGATDTNTSADWLNSSVTNLINIGVYNSEVTIVPIPQTITWTTSFDASSSTTNPLPVAAFATAGTYTFFATFNDGTCTAVDNVVITVLAPTPPMASFMATPLVGSAPLTVNFTDQSTNIPTTWLWTVSPSVGVTFVSATTSASQNPVMQFANAGLYTITLFVSNVAGSDDSTIVQYINVNYCNSTATNTADTDIGNVTFGALNNGTALPVISNPAANSLYTNYMALPAQNFVVGQSYPISLSQITGGVTFYTAFFNAFIDYNNDGAFDPVTERVFNGATNSVGPISTASGSVTIPPTATLGLLRMRIILDESGNATSSPCGTYAYGETEDYMVNIQCASGAPLPGSASICAGQTSTLNASGTNVQWYADAVTATVLASGSSYTTPGLSLTTSYFATSTGVGCGESTRSEFIVTVNQPSSATQFVTECSTYTWPVNSATYTTAGMYTATIPNAAGCDSVITLDLSITGGVTGTDVQSACGTYTWIDGNTYTASNNTATFLETSAAGCDSLVTLDLTILNASASTETAAACVSYTWATNGSSYTSSGTYTATLTNAAGCDSIVTLALTINSPTSSSTSVTTCDTYLWDADGNTYSTAGTYTATLTNAAGCDSIATLILTIGSVSDIGVTLAGGILTADLSGAGVTYQWLDCDNGFAQVPGETSQTFDATDMGNYAVEITENGCVDTSACTLIDDTGLNHNDLTSVSIVPNPTTNLVTLTFEASEARLTILDLNGKIINVLTVNSGDTVDLSAFENGVYLFSIYTDSITAIERVVKQ